MEGQLTKTATGFVPSCKEAQKIFDKMIIGARCKIELIRGRSYDNHKRFFELRDQTFEIQDEFDNEEVWRKQLLIMAGHYEEEVRALSPNMKWILKYLDKYLMGTASGKKRVMDEIERSYRVVFVPKSIAWDKVDELEFREIFKRAVDGFIKNYAPEMDDQVFLRILDFY
jgi:hypothetical protein